MRKLGKTILIAIGVTVILVGGILLTGSYFLVRNMRTAMAEAPARTLPTAAPKKEKKEQPAADPRIPSRPPPQTSPVENAERVVEPAQSHPRATKIAGMIAELNYAYQLAQSEHFEPCLAVCGTPRFKMEKGVRGIEPVEQFLEIHGKEAFKDPRFSRYILKMTFVMGDLFPMVLLKTFLEVEESKGGISDLSAATKFLPVAIKWLSETKDKIGRMRERSRILNDYSDLAKACRDKTVSEENAILQCRDLMAHLNED